MIINRIIKHLLPTAPALSPLWTPWDPITRERKRRRAGEGGWDTGGARRRGWREESSKSKGVIITLLDSFTRTRSRVFVWLQTLCEVMWLQNNLILGTDQRESQQGLSPPAQSDILSQAINPTWLLLICLFTYHFSQLFKDCFSWFSLESQRLLLNTKQIHQWTDSYF